MARQINRNIEKCHEITCGSQTQSSFCVPISFEQELIQASNGGALVPLSTRSSNPEKAHGILKLKFNSGLSKAGYKLYVYNSSDRSNKIVGAHLHIGSANENGPVTVDLYDGSPINPEGLLSEGVIDNNEIATTNPYVNSVGALYQAILNGEIYVNVHSQRFPDGFIRGQIHNDI